MNGRDIIAVGTSAGGVKALRKLVAGLPGDLPASVFVTLHLSSRAESLLPEILSRAGPLPAIRPTDGEVISPGKIYVAPTDHHLLVEPGRVRLGRGPRENMQRPSINAMFRSAASAYGNRVAGVVLTGLLDDGAAGLWEIQQNEGVTIVQDPDEAEFPSMPNSAIAGMDVDYVLRLEKIGPLVGELARAAQSPLARTARAGNRSEKSEYSCPECSGVMIEAHLEPRLVEYRCHTGHRYGPKSMLTEQTAKQERLLWSALAQLEEGIKLLEEMCESLDGFAKHELLAEARERREEARILRELLERREVRSIA